MPRKRNVVLRTSSEKLLDSTFSGVAVAKSGCQEETLEKMPPHATESIPGAGTARKIKDKKPTGTIQKPPEQKTARHIKGIARLVHKANNYYVYEYSERNTGVEIRFKLPLFYKRDYKLHALAHTKLFMAILFSPQHKPQEVA